MKSTNTALRAQSFALLAIAGAVGDLADIFGSSLLFYYSVLGCGLFLLISVAEGK